MRSWGRLLFAAVTGLVLAGAARAADKRDASADRPVLVLTASAPLDPDRLADALRTYLDEFAVDIRTARAVPRGDLRDELGAAADLGASVRAWAVVRIADGAPGSAEIEVVDRVTGKSLVTSVPRARRDEDLYRAVALKVQALLRASLAEPHPGVAESPALARFAATPAPPPPTEDHGLGLETSLTVAAFPSGRVVQQGIAVALARRVWQQRVELALGGQALSGIDARAGEVSATVSRVPLWLAARLLRRARRWEAVVGIVGEAALVSIHPTSSALAVRSGWSVAPALGGEVGARLRLGARAWLGARFAALGVIVGQHLTAQGQPLVTLSGVELAGQVGVGVDFW